MVLTDYQYPILREQVSVSRLETTDLNNLAFGSVFADHMFVADFREGTWQTGKILPYGPLPLSPAMSALHYGQSLFEGMKAFRTLDGRVRISRPLDHLARINQGLERLVMPQLPENLWMAALTELVRLDQAWTPAHDKGSLYLRPFVFATDAYIGVRPSLTYKFMVINMPVNPYYSGAIKAQVATDHIRAAEGGTGFVKMAGNYATAMYPGKLAKEAGYDVVVWLDAKERRYVEEFSTMNAFFVIDGVLVTPANDRLTFLNGLTRDSLLQAAEDLGIEVEVRPIPIDEVVAASKAGTLHEAFGSGTAAVLAPVKQIGYGDTELYLPDVSTWQVGPALKAHLEGIRSGRLPDTHGWMYAV